MEDKIKVKSPTLHRYLFTVTTFSKLLAMGLFILLPFIGFYLGMKYQKMLIVINPSNSLNFTNYSLNQISKMNNQKLNIINLSSVNDNVPQSEYFRAQIEAPIDYFVTDDEMLNAFDSQGGMAPPRLILMKNSQVLASEDYLNEITNISKNDCIAIWSTLGFSSVDEWNQNTGFIGNTTNKEIVTVGNRRADIYQLSKKDGDIYVAYLPIGKDGELSYYFNTCNANNKTDLINVIKSIKFRGDLNLGQ